MFDRRTVALGSYVCAHLILTSSVAIAQDWQRYRNERYGFTLVYPADLLVTERAAEAGDGQVFADCLRVGLAPTPRPSALKSPRAIAERSALADRIARQRGHDVIVVLRRTTPPYDRKILRGYASRP
jgi:hypothetical protein